VSIISIVVMNKTFLMILLVAFLLSCSKENEQNRGVLIKGNISGSKGEKGIGSFSYKSGELTDAKNVLVLFGDQSSVSEVINGKVSLYAPANSATALIFVDANNQYIGNLFVSGLNILPLVNLSEGDQTVIDLSSLYLDGTNVLPAYNPIGNEIQINQLDINIYKELGAYYESLAKNIDTDNDGIPDNFSGKQIVLNTTFNLTTVGTMGINNNPPSEIDTSKLIINYSLRIHGWKNLIPQNLNISLTGPEDDPCNDIVKINYTYGENGQWFDVAFERKAQMPDGSTLALPFKKGIYTFTMDGINNHTISYSSINARYFLVLAVPTLKTGSDGKVTSVTIDYMLPDKTITQPSKFITTLMLQFHDKNGTTHQEGAIFDLQHPLPDFKNVVLSSPLNLNDIDKLCIIYTDLVGNIYYLDWKKP